MNLTAEDLHHRLDQLRLLASETDDPLSERLVRDLIVELEDMLSAHVASEEKWTRGSSAASALSKPRQKRTSPRRREHGNEHDPEKLKRKN